MTSGLSIAQAAGIPFARRRLGPAAGARRPPGTEAPRRHQQWGRLFFVGNGMVRADDPCQGLIENVTSPWLEAVYRGAKLIADHA